MKKKAKDLIPGDVIKDYGVLIDFDLNPEPNGFWVEPNMTYFDLNDSFNGPFSCIIKEKEFEVFTERDEITKAYNSVDCHLAERIADLMEYRREFNIIKQDYFKTKRE